MQRIFRNHTRRSFNALVATVAFASLLALNVGFVGVYHVAKMHWYHQQLVAKPGETTVTLHMTKDEFEHGGTKRYEWQIDGESYDMRSYTVTDSGVTVVAVHDIYEHELANILTAGFHHHDKRSSRPVQQWVKILITPALPVQPMMLSVFRSTVNLFFFNEKVSARLYVADILDPPLIG